MPPRACPGSVAVQTDDKFYCDVTSTSPSRCRRRRQRRVKLTLKTIAHVQLRPRCPGHVQCLTNERAEIFIVPCEFSAAGARR